MADTSVKLSGTYDSIEAYNIMVEMQEMSADYEAIRTEAAAAASAATAASAAATNAINTANTAVSNAQTYAGNASDSADDAAGYAANASTSATNAASSATDAANSAAAASTSETNAAASATAAAASEAVVNGALPLSGGTMTGNITLADGGNPLSTAGGTMTGALNTANNIWNNLGDDAAFGDHNVAGKMCVKTQTSTATGIAFFNSSNTNVGQVEVNNEFKFNKPILVNSNTVLTNGTTGTMVTKSISSAVSLAQATAKTITSISLSAGTWVVTGHAHWSSTTADKGYSIQITNAANTLQYANDSAMAVHSANSGHLSLQTCRIWNLTATTTIYLCGYTTAASSVADADIKAVRIV